MSGYGERYDQYYTAVEAALRDVMKTLCDMMGFSPAPMTKT